LHVFTSDFYITSSLTVCLCVCLSVTLWYNINNNRSTIMQFSPNGCPRCCRSQKI